MQLMQLQPKIRSPINWQRIALCFTVMLQPLPVAHLLQEIDKIFILSSCMLVLAL